MPLFRSSASGLAALALEGTLGARLAGQLEFQAKHQASPAEIRTWERSLPVLTNDLLDAGLGDVEVLVEHGLPLSSQRIDAVLAGQDPRRPAVVRGMATRQAASASPRN